NEIAALGISQMPGGQGVFGSLTVSENLRMAGWTRQGRDADTAIEDVLGTFPVLRERYSAAAADLSGGQQQMLALGMAFVAKPRVLLIDELSLGLAPVIVGELLPLVRRLADDGVAVVLVEQSVNIALTIAERAYFMERGAIRFSGPTADLLNRPDLLRSVFLTDVAAPGAVVAQTDVTDRPALEVVGLERSFGSNHAVREVSFAVGQREVVGMIGPNGAGKTTLFDLISGYVTADEGRVLLDGRDITNDSATGRARQGLGRSFQDARLFPDMTVVEALAVSLERWTTQRSVLAAALRFPTVFDDEERTTARVDELIELMNLGQYRNSFIRELSTGTRRIVDLACLVGLRPTVVLLDEPSSGIAQREVEALAPVLLRLRDEMGASLLVIEHDLPLVSSISDRLIALDRGSVVATGSPADVLTHPDVVESYIGNNAAAQQRSGNGG
ncbi:MAG TPA: ATP-binding cassette domain-containing protein, partial [Ilumatobacteraceae bacterium]